MKPYVLPQLQENSGSDLVLVSQQVQKKNSECKPALLHLKIDIVLLRAEWLRKYMLDLFNSD